MYERLQVYKGTYMWTFDIVRMYKHNGKWTLVRFPIVWRGGDYASWDEAFAVGMGVLNGLSLRTQFTNELRRLNNGK